MTHKSSIGHLKRFDTFFLKRIAPPSHSRLYHIEPIGVGTSMVESFTSYVTRVALAHCVTVGILINTEIMPQINKSLGRDISPRANPFKLAYSARAVNGFNITTRNWVNSLQALTLRQELRHLTMLAWKNLTSYTQLFRRFRAWCPYCYEEWLQQGNPIYDPLLWDIKVVTACTIHKRSLCKHCIHCKKRIPGLYHTARPGFCTFCGQWLGVAPGNILFEDTELVGEHFSWQRWVFNELGAMLAALPKLPDQPKRGLSANLVSLCIQKLTRGDLKAFVFRFNSFNDKTLVTWIKDSALPELNKLIRLCYLAEVSMKGILLHGENINAILRSSPIRKKGQHRITSIELEKMKRALLLIVKEEPPPSLNEAAKRLGCCYQTFNKYFPEHYDVISERYNSYKKSRFDIDKVAAFLSIAKDEFPPPSLSSVAKMLGCSTSFLRLRFLEDCIVITNRHAKFRKAFPNPEEVRVKLEALQSEFPPLSVIQCAERIDCTRESLTRYFPELTRAIGIRFKNYRREKVKYKEMQLRTVVREILVALEKERLPLTAYQIKKRLPHMKNLDVRRIAVMLPELIAEKD